MIPNLDYWVLQTLAMMLTAILIPGLRISGPLSALLTVIVIAYINSRYWDAALFFALPESLTIQTVGLFLTNGLLFWIVVKLLPGIDVDGFLPALMAPVIFTISSFIIGRYGTEIDWARVWDGVTGIVSSLRDFFESDQQATTPTQ